MRDPWKHLMGNVELSAAYGSNGGRELLNPKTNKPIIDLPNKIKYLNFGFLILLLKILQF